MLLVSGRANHNASNAYIHSITALPLHLRCHSMRVLVLFRLTRASAGLIGLLLLEVDHQQYQQVHALVSGRTGGRPYGKTIELYHVTKHKAK